MNVVLLFVILGAVVLGYYLMSLHRCTRCGGKGWKDRWGTRLTGRRSR
jgi:hypothetical protein